MSTTWKIVIALIIAAIIGFGISHYGFNNPPPVQQTDPHKQPAPGPG